ncbi:hypothetical protein EYF80_052863 [Liparis tanakae]|uniref:Uncharacterized protein n=1 Tax=Liparis tanakae TaxID=230148 RepID=A0A4Z2F760_9TELE|nr:hypothetical protein EYF80_052863 [Liparis tanakae]
MPEVSDRQVSGCVRTGRAERRRVQRSHRLQGGKTTSLKNTSKDQEMRLKALERNKSWSVHSGRGSAGGPVGGPRRRPPQESELKEFLTRVFLLTVLLMEDQD